MIPMFTRSCTTSERARRPMQRTPNAAGCKVIAGPEGSNMKNIRAELIQRHHGGIAGVVPRRSSVGRIGGNSGCGLQQP